MNYDKFRSLGIFASVTLLCLAVETSPGFSDGDDGTRGPQPGSGGNQQKDKKKDKQSEIQLRDGYLAARALIIEGKYQAGITAMKKLDHDDLPDIANYIGYANRKLDNYDTAKIWYERALTSDPNHIRTWQYYGMWQVERGNMLKAAEHLEKLRQLCGTDCKEYADLKSAMEGHIHY
jgi:tetratricopeptide (TPR) repeat protein